MLFLFFYWFQNVKLIQLAVSLGGVQSLIEVAGAMTHAEKFMSAAEQKEGGLNASLVRFRYDVCVSISLFLFNDVFCWTSHVIRSSFSLNPCFPLVIYNSKGEVVPKKEEHIRAKLDIPGERRGGFKLALNWL